MTGVPRDSHEFTGASPIEIRVNEHIGLRQLTVADSEAHFDLIDRNRAHLSQHGDDTSEKYPTLESVQERNAVEKDGEYRFGIWFDNQTMLGVVKLTEVSPECTEVGYWLGEQYQGSGIMTESVETVRDYAINTRGYKEVIAWIEESNIPSRAVVRRLGFEQFDSRYNRIRTKGDEVFVDALFSYSEGRGDIETFEISDFFRNLAPLINNVPELGPAIGLAIADPEHAADVYNTYVGVITKLSRLKGDELGRIKDAWEKLSAASGQVGSASHSNARDILFKMSKPDRINMAREATDAIYPSSKYHQATLDQFVSRLEGGHIMKVRGIKPTDGDPEADAVIWGHTQITDPEALLHFSVCHYLERYFAHVLPDQGVDFAATEKDFFINAMIDIVILDHFSNRKFDEIFKLWLTPKADGGLGWIKQDRVDSFATDN